MDELQYHIMIVVAAIATVLAVLTALIYSWVCCRTRPLKLPTVSLTSLMWMFASVFAWRLYVTMSHTYIEYDYPVLSALMMISICGYAFFLIGTFKDATLIHHVDPLEPPEPEE